MALDLCEYLFPSDLAVTQAPIRRILFIGSCVAQATMNELKVLRPEVSFDFVAFNNTGVLPELSREAAAAYDFQYVALPLRDVLTDRVVDFSGFLSEREAEETAEVAMERLAFMLAASLRHSIEHGLLTFVANFVVPQVAVTGALSHHGSERDLSALVRRLNERLASLVAGYRNAFVADVDAIGGSLGKSRFHDDAISFYSHGAFWCARFVEHDTAAHYNAPATGRIEPIPDLGQLYTFEFERFFRAVWRQAECLHRIVHQVDQVKLVIFDLDDTLWRGQIAEHYGDEGSHPVLDGWPVGIWEAVQHLRARGILTAICSKNEESLVRARWDRAVSQPWLKLEDFTFAEIGWRPKAESVAAIMAAASLTPRSVVFVDDNPVEREAVKAAFPEIRTLGANPYVTRRILLWSPETQVAALTDESKARHRMVRRQQDRERARASLSREEFLLSLECRVDMAEVSSLEDPRFVRSLELINKTNQFNTTGERLSHTEAAGFLAAGGRFHVFEVEDRFTSYGLVGVVRLKDGCFEQFAMSCRVLGLEVEVSALRYLMMREADTTGRTMFRARVVPTAINMVCRDVFERAGFSRREDGTFARPDKSLDLPADHLRFTPALVRTKPSGRRGWAFWRKELAG